MAPLSRRLIHVASAAKVVSARDVALGTAHSLGSGPNAPAPESSLDVDLGGSSSPTSSLPVFRPLGSPATMIQVSLPASVQLYTRRNSLAGAVGARLQGLSSGLHAARSPLARLLAGAPLVYHRIASTSPVEALVSSNAGRRRSLFGGWSWHLASSTPTSQDTFSVLQLDGTVDWVAAPKSVYAYSGDLLSQHIDVRARNIRLTGRGQVALAAKGQMFQVVLAKGESLLVRKDCLVAYSTDLNQKHVLSVRDRISIPYSLEAGTSTQSSSPTPRNNDPVVNAARPSWPVRAASAVWTSLKHSLKSLRGEPRQFVRLEGPTVVLFNGMTARDIWIQKDRVAPVEAQMAQSAKDLVDAHDTAARHAKSQGLRGKPSDHFKIVTIGDDGKASFQSTDSFANYRNK